MSGGPKFEYLWADLSTSEYKKPTQLPAPRYVSNFINQVKIYHFTNVTK